MVVDTAYYELLGVEPNATSLEIKKAYRKAAIRLHPDKNPDDPMAASNFQEVGEAYQVLSDESLRAKYDKFGKQESIPSEGFEDPSEFFSMIFGGEAFKDWIGQLSLIEELAKSAELSGYTDETNRDERKEDTNGTAKKSGEGSTQFYLDNKSHDQTPNTKKDEDVITDSADKELTKEQSEEKKRKDELEKYEEECRIKKKEMIKELSQKLIDKLSLFTETDMQADVVYSFQEKLKYEAESLKMESFGLEILHTLGSIYKTKSKIFLKNQTFFGWGGLWWSVKDKGGVFKDTFKTIATALDAQKTMQEYTTMQEDNEYHMKKEAEEKEKAQEELAKAESGLEELKLKQKEEKIEENTEDSKKQEKKEDKIPEKHTEEEVLEMEKHLLGKVLAAAWSGSKFEIQGSVRSVCDAILDDGEVPIEKRVARAKGLRIIGDVFASVKRTEAEAEEARVFEELVAEASKKREKKKPATEDKQEKQDKE